MMVPSQMNQYGIIPIERGEWLWSWDNGVLYLLFFLYSSENIVDLDTNFILNKFMTLNKRVTLSKFESWSKFWLFFFFNFAFCFLMQNLKGVY